MQYFCRCYNLCQSRANATKSKCAFKINVYLHAPYRNKFTVKFNLTEKDDHRLRSVFTRPHENARKRIKRCHTPNVRALSI